MQLTHYGHNDHPILIFYYYLILISPFCPQPRPPAEPKLARRAGLRPPAGRRPAGGLRARQGVQKHKVL